eukprot:Skav215639  [mRNA]  locus=scaffold736:197173:203009:- [translate_table: standard]
MFHRVSRRVAASLAASGGNVLMKKLNRVFKYSRGPFATDKNGRTLQEFKIALVKALKRGNAQELAEMYLCGVARDLGRDVSSFDVSDLVAVRTVSDCTGSEALIYLGALNDGPETEELLHFHSRLFTSFLAHLSDLSVYQLSYPWRAVSALEVAQLPALLKDMKKTWKFTTRFVDGLRPQDKLYDLFFFTRFQPFRDIMVKAEHIAFDSNLVNSKGGEAFLAGVRAVAGLAGKGKGTDSLMSSLPSELVFNDLRDTCRRAKKSDRTIPANLHSCAAKSVQSRTKALPTLGLEDKDWSSSLVHGGHVSVKSSVHHAMRCTDASLGVSAHGLTKSKSNKALTKPHVFVARLEAFMLLRDCWTECDGDDDQKEKAVLEASRATWLCRLLTTHMFIRVEGSHGCEEDSRLLILASGPNAIKALKLKYNAAGDCFAREDSTHASPVVRGNPSDLTTPDKVPPGVTLNYGVPDKSSPFVQLKLPQGMSFEAKKSRSVSFMATGIPMSGRGTTRTRENALDCVLAWGWEWWGSLTDSQKNSIRSMMLKRSHSDDESIAGEASKKRKSLAAAT